MSIYATYWILKFPALGDEYPGCEWINVIGQGVPGHIGTATPGYGYEDGDPYAQFLPPAIPVVDDEGDALRGKRPRLVAQLISGSETQLIFEDGTRRNVDDMD